MIGTRLGPYEIIAKLGEGGMGVVYRAKDSQLGREVALKVLPEGFTQDAERLARFEREARLLAQLNHPSIAHVYGLEASGETRALVLELVEGPTLAERLAPGALAIEESLSIARQIAEALEAAHDKGIVHRDLKPQNVKAPLEGGVKVLDFGLAKAMDPLAGASGGASASQLAASPTLTLGATVQGVILGTAAYMSPEQAKGLAVDQRADIWAFGVVLFEMLTGRPLFAGDSVPDTLARVLQREIDFAALPAATPAAVRRLLRRCLTRQPKDRLHHIADVRIVLDDVLAGRADETPAVAPRSAPSRTRERLAFALGALVLAGLVWTLARRGSEPAPRPPARFHLLPPEGSEFDEDGPVVLSPDGQSIVFVLRTEGADSKVAVRQLDAFEARELPGTAGVYEPFWSPDGRAVAFFGTHLETIDAGGLAPPRKLAPVRDGRGASWSAQGVLLYAPEPAGPLFRVDAAGGEPAAVTALDAERQEIAHLRPSFLPDGRRFVYLVRSARPENSGIYAGSLDGGLKKRLLQIDVAARFVPPRHLLVAQGDLLVARELDLERLELVGEPTTLARGIEYSPQFDYLPVSASNDGRLVYHPLSSGQLRQIVRIDRAGKRLATLGDPGDFNFDLSPDGRRLAFVRMDPAVRRLSVWIHDLERDVRSRLATETGANGPVWSPDGSYVAYATESSSAQRIGVRPADGGAERVLWADPMIIEPIDWSPDGRWLLVETGAPGEKSNLFLVPADGSAAVEPFAKTNASEHSGRFSPDGRYVAYVSNESGREEVYVQPLPQTGVQWLVSRRGGDSPRWGAKGRELFYVEPGERSGTHTLVAVPFTGGGSAPVLGLPTALAPLPSIDLEVTAGGREFFVGAPVVEALSRPPVLIDNWLALLAPGAAP